MKLRLTFAPPATQEDFDGVLEALRLREHTKKKEDARKLRTELMNSNLPDWFKFRLLRSSGFNLWAERTMQEWKVVSAEWPEIIYEYDTTPISLEALCATFLDNTLAKMVNRDVVDNFWTIQEGSHRKMIESSEADAGLPKGTVKVERLA